MTEYVYLDGKYVDKDKAMIPVMTHAFLYGTAVFEGMRAYYNEDEKCMVVDYNIDVKNALEKYKEIYEPYVSNGKVK